MLINLLYKTFKFVMKYGTFFLIFILTLPLVHPFDIFNFFSQCGNDYDFHYKTPHKYLSMSEYIDSLDSNRFIQKFVEELIIDGTVNDLKKLASSFSEYIFIVIFGFFFILCTFKLFTIHHSMALLCSLLVLKVRSV